MHRTAQIGPRCISKVPARVIAGRRLPATRLSSLERHAGQTRHIALPSFPPWTSRDAEKEAENSEKSRHADNIPPNPPSQPPASDNVAESVEAGTGPSGSYGREKIPSYGSAARRWQRNRRPKEIPQIVIPSWFLERNVLLKEQEAALTEGRLDLVAATPAQSRSSKTKEESTLANSTEPSGQDGAPTADTSPAEVSAGHRKGSTSSRRYTINESLMHEIVASLSGCLYSSRFESADSFPIAKSHLKLHSPVDGATYFLDKIVEKASSRVGADLIRIDAQDLAEIAGDYIKEGVEASSHALWTLGYDTQQLLPRAQSQHEQLEEDEEEEVEEDNEAEELGAGDKPRGMPGFAVTTIPMDGKLPGRLPPALRQLIEQLNKGGGEFMGQGANMPRGMAARGGMPMQVISNGNGGKEQWNDLKLGHLLETLLEANQLKRLDLAETNENNSATPAADIVSVPTVPEAEAETSSKSATRPPWPLPKTVIHIRNFKELASTHKGNEVVDRVLELVQKKRREGQSITIVGSTASSELTPELSKAGFDGLQNESPESLYRTVVVTPEEAGPHGGLFFNDESLRNYEINYRNIRDMVRRFDSRSAKSPRELVDLDEDRSASLRAALEDRPLSFDEVHRIALTLVGTKAALGGEGSKKAMFKSQDVLHAIELLSWSDRAKTRWAADESSLQAEKERPAQAERPRKTASEKRIAKIKKQCNKYEKRLLNGVVDPESLRTTFDDVHAPTETIESLKMLTTLSLTRPDAFKYGVLATDKITGALLYGPPGTGKTLLAKAVAKESGATVLEVSGSDVYDMYVGEGEKNVRAIFSLAKKLSPCVVFIDEADAIFASRGSSVSRNSHRELINQFLREWDGMTDTTAFIMVATNRPFDLDDAALRRLPRRLLVDLPTEKERVKILEIHLKDEALDSTVSIEKLAAETKLHSGSDLKNLAVAAALRAVREENDQAAQHRAGGSEQAFEFPPKRVLSARHFEQAMQEITASVSEDMGTLSAIRKFDEKYGDKRGKKKKPGYGFQTGEEAAKDTVKVRS